MGYWVDKVNASPKQKKIKKALEELGHTNVEVWWEQLESAMEMCGPGGGYAFHSDQESMEPLGYSFEEAMEKLCTLNQS
jgi:hypothetical protein